MFEFEQPIKPCSEDEDMQGEVLIRVQNVSKRFCRDLKRSLVYGVQDIASDIIGIDRSASGLRRDEFWANKDISFQLCRGECLGLIGSNGAGKTTLLKLLNGLIKPDQGRIEIRGRVGALIALGAGFNPILTGRENVYIAGSILGLKRHEIQAKYDEIVAFSELADFMETPVQSYSSGMQVRLGFAVATAMKPDVLLIDEVLAVGDFNFRMRCLDRIQELLQDTAVILVSHSEQQVRRVANRGLLLNAGSMWCLDDVESAFSEYHDLVETAVEDATSSYFSDEIEFGRIVSPLNFDISFGEGIEIIYECLFRHPVGQVCIRIVFFDISREVVAEWNSRNHGVVFKAGSGGDGRFVCQVKSLSFKSGRYTYSFVVEPLNQGPKYYARIDQVGLVRVSGEDFLVHSCQI